MEPQIVPAGWMRGRELELGCKAGLSDEFLLLQGGDTRHKRAPSTPKHPSSLSVFSVIYNGWRCCCVTERIQKGCVWGSNLSICVVSFWFLLEYLLLREGTTCTPSGWTYVFDVAPFRVHIFIERGIKKGEGAAPPLGSYYKRWSGSQDSPITS